MNKLYRKFLDFYLSNQKFRLIDFELLKLIQDSSIEQLRDIQYIEQNILNKIGLNNDRPEMFPENLRGFGLYQAQYPIQFAPYLYELSLYNIKSYLELGVRHGGTFTVTVEYLKKFNKLSKALAIDIGYSPTIIEFAKNNPFVEFKQTNSLTPAFREYAETLPTIDLVMIDAGHTYKECLYDLNSLFKKANIIVLHDISNDNCKGVGEVWREFKNNYKGNYIFKEYTAQYPAIFNRTKKSYLGIGIAINIDYYATRKRNDRND